MNAILTDRKRVRRLCVALLILSLLAAWGGRAAAAASAAPRLDALAPRSLGPTITPGRIADIAVNPVNRNIWYVATGSSGLWKTSNRGDSWEPMMDDGQCYSWGCVTIDPKNPDVVWVGAGENQSIRSISFGDGVYKTTDNGRTWRHMGLRDSEHIGKIVIDPRDSNVVYVAAQGPLWRSGGDRGLYKTTDGGETWRLILQPGLDTGVSDLVLDPRNPDVIYAAAYQRRRHTGMMVGAGPEAGIFKSEDGGATWVKLSQGLPTSYLGRIGLAISPHNPDVIYALVVAAENQSGFFKSADRGMTWTRQSNYFPQDPQYYGEIYCDPWVPGRLYSMDMQLQWSQDEGATWEAWPAIRGTHVDYHALAFDPGDPNHLLIGNDGGLYESYDGGRTWRHFTNMPTIQYYHLALDNAVPFYNVYGGAQDNGSSGGPTRTIHSIGIRTSDWIVVGGGDGMQPRVDPTDPNILYVQSQNGAINRRDLRTGASVGIRPTAPEGVRLRWNWNSPLIISPHSPSRLYFAANVLFRSDDRGDSWRAVSPDLTRQLDRNQLPIMGRLLSEWPDDPVTKNRFTTDLGVCSALAESPLREGLLFFGTDEGLIQISEDGGATWRRIEHFPGVPERAYVSDIYPSNHDVNTVYAAFENHLYGDFAPYLLKSTDLGRTWVSIAGDLPPRHFVWSVIEDHVNPDLLFAGTEFGLFVTVDGGRHWTRLPSPPAAFRDLEVQRRETDLVGATFGRGFFVLDDYSPLRGLTQATLASRGAMLPLRHAYLYNQLSLHRSQWGNYATPNPPFGAGLTYYLRDTIDTSGTQIVLLVRDAQGNEVRRLTGPTTAGIHRVYWDLRRAGGGRGGARRGGEAEPEPGEVVPAETSAPARGAAAGQRGARGARGGGGAGPLVSPGVYNAALAIQTGDQLTLLGEPQSFEVKIPAGIDYREGGPGPTGGDDMELEEETYVEE